MHIGELSELDDTIFNIKSYIRRPYERLDDIHQILSYEFDHNLLRVDRAVYNGLDWLGDLGGLKEALVVVLGTIATFLNYYDLENHLVQKLLS